MAAVIQAPAQVYKPCGFNTGGATKEYCKSISAIPVRQKQGCIACACPWKAKMPRGAVSPQRPAALQHAPDSVRRSPPFNTKKPTTRPATPVPKLVPTAPLAVEAKEEAPAWRAILDRIKKAMAEGTLVKLEPRTIQPLPGQPREYFDSTGMEKLEKSIREVGQIQCGLVRRISGATPITHELLDGERRWRVVSHIDGVLYRAIEVEIDDEAAPFIVAAIANFNRAEHTPMEITMAIEKLHTRLEAPMEVVAEMLGFSIHWAYQMRGLINLCREVRDMLDPNLAEKEKDLLPVTAAIHISKLDQGLQANLARRFLAGDISMRQLRKEVVRIGDEHGKPVRTREQKPSKQMEVLANLAKNLGILAHDLLMFVDRADFSDFICGRDPEKVARMQRGLISAEDAILISKHKIAEALARKR